MSNLDSSLSAIGSGRIGAPLSLGPLLASPRGRGLECAGEVPLRRRPVDRRERFRGRGSERLDLEYIPVEQEADDLRASQVRAQLRLFRIELAAEPFQDLAANVTAGES
jgi:hypothetical protein